MKILTTFIFFLIITNINLWSQDSFLSNYKSYRDNLDNREPIQKMLLNGDKWSLISVFSLKSFEETIPKLSDKELHRLYVGGYLLGYEHNNSFKSLHSNIKDKISGSLIIRELEFFQSKKLNVDISVDGILSLAANSNVNLQRLQSILSAYNVSPKSIIDIKSQLIQINKQLEELNLSSPGWLNKFAVVRDQLVSISNLGNNVEDTGDICLKIYKWLQKNLTKNEETINYLYGAVNNVYTISDNKKNILKHLNDNVLENYKAISTKKSYIDFFIIRNLIDTFMALPKPKNYQLKSLQQEVVFDYSKKVKGEYDSINLKYLEIDIYIFLHQHGNKWAEDKLNKIYENLYQYITNTANFKNKEYYNQLFGLINIDKFTKIMSIENKEKLIAFFKNNILKMDTDTQLLVEESFGVKPDFGTNEITYEKILSDLKAKKISEIDFFKSTLSLNESLKEPFVYEIFKKNKYKLYKLHPAKLLRMYKSHATGEDFNFVESIWYQVRPNTVDLYFEVLVERKLKKNYLSLFNRYSMWPLPAKKGVANTLKYFIEYEQYAKTLEYLAKEKDPECIAGFMDGLKVIIAKTLQKPKSLAFQTLKEKLYSTESLSEWAILTTIIYDVDRASDYKFNKDLNVHRKSNLDKYFEMYETNE